MSDYAVVNPATGETVKTYPTISDADLKDAIARADDRSQLLRPPALLELDPFQINSIAQDGNDFWIGTSGGLYLYRNDKVRRIGAAPPWTLRRSGLT